MKTYNSISDVRREISDQPIDTCFYSADYVDQVADEYLNLLISKGFSWGEEIPEVSDVEFWECFHSSHILCDLLEYPKNKEDCEEKELIESFTSFKNR